VTPVARLLNRMLAELSAREYPVDDLVEGYILVDRCRTHPDMFIHGLDRLKRQLNSRTSVHRPIYWAVVRERLHRRPQARWSEWRMTEEMLTLTREDLPWLLVDATSLTDPVELQVAFETALAVWYMAGRSETEGQMIADAVGRSSAGEELVNHVRQSIWPPPREETPREKEFRERRAERERAERAALAQAREDLGNRIEGIRRGEGFGALVYLYRRMLHSEAASHSTLGQTNWQGLIPEFGEDLAHAARDGFKACWRNWRPPLSFERAGETVVEHGVTVGLTGLAIAAGDDANFQHLSAEEAETAVHYALRELTGFPEWFEALAEGQPEVVRRVISRQLVAELTAQTDAPDPGDALSRLRYGPAAVRVLCAELVLDQMIESDPPRTKALEDALQILVHADDTVRTRLREIAAARAQEHAVSGHEEALLFWLIAWLWVDGSGAWRFVETLIDGRDETPSSLILRLAAVLRDNQWTGSRIEGADFLRPDVLERMIRVVYAHVRPEEDGEHERRYSPDVRDRAQEFREWMLQFLAKQPGEGAQAALQALATDLEPVHVRRWIRKLAEQQAAKAVEYSPWTPSGVAEFGAVHGKAPTSADELFEITVDRLEDIKEAVERSDFSDRALFTPRMLERPIQRWLAGRLERESRGRYTVIREEEVDRRDETDIRLHNPVAGIVTIEVKPVDSQTGRYTLNELVGALEEQLVGQYLRSADSRHGVLVVAMLEKRRWNPRNGSGMLYSSQLIERLNERGPARSPQLTVASRRFESLGLTSVSQADRSCP
jgi:hypothetical protein